MGAPPTGYSIGVPDFFDRAVEVLGDVASPWAYFIVFGAAMAETALLIGTFFPDETILLVAGFLAWKGKVSLEWLVLAAVLGAIAGDSVGYLLGRRFGRSVRHSSLGQKLGDHRWERAEEYMRNRGGKAVFFARWITGPKSIVPVLAGQSRMPYRTFVSWNAASAVGWGIFHVGIGYVVGPSVEAVDTWLGRAGWIVLGLVVLGALGVFLWRRYHKGSDDRDRHGARSGSGH